jgi:Protein of unknown function (DUF4230)
MAQLMIERDTITEAPEAHRQVEQPPTGKRPQWQVIPVAFGMAMLLLFAVRGVVDVLPKWANPFEPNVVDRTPAALLVAMEDLAEYHAATGTFQVLVDLEHDTPYLPSLISGERVTFLAEGNVDAVVDFSSLEPERVSVSADRKSVVISMPAPHLAEPQIDHETSRIVDRDRGLVQRIGAIFQDNPTSERELYQLAEEKLQAAANESDLTKRAEENTRSMLTALARSLGFTDVHVTFSGA